MFKQFFTLIILKLRRSSWAGLIVRRLLDRLIPEPIEPVTNRFLDNIMAFSECVKIVSLLSADRRENTLSRDLSRCLLT